MPPDDQIPREKRAGAPDVRRASLPERLSRRPDAWAFLLFLCLSILTLGANPFRGETLAPVDLLVANPGWAAAVGPAPAARHWESTDIIDGVLPFWISLKQQIRQGRGAFWNPVFGGGVPVNLDLLNPSFLLFLAIGSHGAALYAIALLKLVVGGFGAYLMLRAFLGWFPSLWGGVVFMLCGFNAAWFFWDQAGTAIWIPWLLAATARYLRSGERKWLPAVGVAAWLLITGAFFAVAAFGFYAFTLLVLVWIAWDLRADAGAGDDRRGRIAGALKKGALPFLAVAFAFWVAAAALVPFVKSMEDIDLGYRAGGGTHFTRGVRDLLLFLKPESPLRIERTGFIGPIALVFAFAGIARAWTTRDGALRRFGVFCALLALLSILIAFGLLPHALIRAIPLLGFNNWSRLLSTALLGLSALSALGIDLFLEKLPPLAGRRIALFAAIALLSLQFLSQKALFNAFNAVVPAAWLYPDTPSIRHVREKLQPLQYAIPDESYGPAGTLGGCAIPSWYSHGFRTEATKKILGAVVDDAFPSATSGWVVGAKIRDESPLVERLGVRFLLIGRQYFERETVTNGEESADVAPPLPENRWVQRVTLPVDSWVASIGFHFHTYGLPHAPSGVRLAIDGQDGRRVAAEAVLPADRIHDHAWADFVFDRPVQLRAGSHVLSLSMGGKRGGAPLSAWTTADTPGKENPLSVNGSPAGASLQMRMKLLAPFGPLLRDPKWKVLALEPEILVLENTRVAGGAYFMARLDDPAAPMTYEGVATGAPSGDRVEIRYTGSAPGWIVLPMHLHPNWTARVDGRLVKHDSYLGMMPAVPVSGRSDIVFRYRPNHFLAGTAVSALGLAAFLWFTRACLDRKRRRG